MIRSMQKEEPDPNQERSDTNIITPAAGKNKNREGEDPKGQNQLALSEQDGQWVTPPKEKRKKDNDLHANKKTKKDLQSSRPTTDD